MRHSRTKKTGRFGLVMDPQMRVAIEREAEQRDHLASLAASNGNQTAAQR